MEQKLAECDAALAFAPDFVAALAWTATARGCHFGEVVGKVLALGPPPPVPTLSAATDSGASKGFVDDPDEAFKYQLSGEHDDLESTGLSTPGDPTKLSAAARAGAPPREDASDAVAERDETKNIAPKRRFVPDASGFATSTPFLAERACVIYRESQRSLLRDLGDLAAETIEAETGRLDDDDER